VRDLDLRKALRVRAAQHHAADPEARIVEELELGLTARADVIVLNGRIEGYEIKSDHDSLVRLAHQAAAYEAVCDRVWLVTTERFAAPAIERLPVWWGVLVARTKGETVSLVRRRAARAHPRQSQAALLELLWRDELAELCGRYAPQAVRARSTSSALRDAIIETDASAKRLASDVRAALLIREGWRAVPPCASGDAVFPPVARWSGSRSGLPPHRRR
jgi:plasmid stability protein